MTAKVIIEQFRQRYRKNFEPDQSAALLPRPTLVRRFIYGSSGRNCVRWAPTEEITCRIAELAPYDTNSCSRGFSGGLKTTMAFATSRGEDRAATRSTLRGPLLAVSRHGLSERELVELLAPGDTALSGAPRKMCRATWPR